MTDQKTIPDHLVRAFLDIQKNKLLTVTFIKVDGTERTVNGQLKATSRLVGSDKGVAQGEAMKARGQVWIACPNGESKSFYLDRVIRINAGKAKLEAV